MLYILNYTLKILVSKIFESFFYSPRLHLLDLNTVQNCNIVKYCTVKNIYCWINLKIK